MTREIVVAHGVASTYAVRGCRCDDCTEAQRRRCAAQQVRRYRLTQENGGVAPTAQHGVSTYNNWGCRCASCCAAKSAANSNRYRNRAKASERVAS